MARPSDLYLRCKICDRADPQDRRLRKLIREVYSANGLGSRLPFGRPSSHPAEELGRWGVAMALRAFESLGVLSDRAEVLAVGPSTEPAVEWLIPRAERVRYLPDPASALELDEGDGSFGAILCSGVLERLPGRSEAVRAAGEFHRVLRPGGVAAVSLGFRLEGPPPGPTGKLLLDEIELRETILGEGLTWALTSPLDLAASSPLVVRQGAHVWTSAHLLLVKPLYH